MSVCVLERERERERETWLTRKRFERFHKYIISGIKCTKANNIVGKKKYIKQKRKKVGWKGRQRGEENKQMDRQTHREAGRQKYR